jgi:hypothetical protein
MLFEISPCTRISDGLSLFKDFLNSANLSRMNPGWCRIKLFATARNS